MKKKLYYSVVKETEVVFDTDECTGFKSITMYGIENNELNTIGVINDIYNSDVSIDVIQEWLDDNGCCDDEFEFILL
jgi:hypothetical protein